MKDKKQPYLQNKKLYFCVILSTIDLKKEKKTNIKNNKNKK